MIMRFTETCSKKLIKELNLDIIPTVRSQVKFNGNLYHVTGTVLDMDKVHYVIYIRRLR